MDLVPADHVFQGSLFTNDFLRESITRISDWAALSERDIEAIDGRLQEIVQRFPIGQSPNESQTEDDLIWPVLAALGWPIG